MPYILWRNRKDFTVVLPGWRLHWTLETGTRSSVPWMVLWTDYKQYKGFINSCSGTISIVRLDPPCLSLSREPRGEKNTKVGRVITHSYWRHLRNSLQRFLSNTCHRIHWFKNRHMRQVRFLLTSPAAALRFPSIRVFSFILSGPPALL